MRMFLDHEGRLRLPWRLLIYLAGLAGVQIAAAIAVGIGVAIFLLARGEPVEMDTVDAWILPLTILAAPVITAAAVVLTILCRRFLDRRSMKSLGLVFPISRPVATVLVRTVAGGAPIVAATAILVAAGAMKWSGLGGRLAGAPLAADTGADGVL